MNTAKTTGLTIKKQSKRLVLCGLTCLAPVIGLAIAILNPNADANAISPPDTCFAFSTGTITKYYSNEGNNSANPACPKTVDIPSTIGGVAVTKIGDNAFQKKGLTGLTIPSSITTIGNLAFETNQLTSVTIPSSVTSIGFAAFSVNQLTNLTIPSSVTIIGDYAFAYNQITDPVVLGSPTGANIFQADPISSISYNGTVHTIRTSPTTPVDACFNFTPATGTITSYRAYDLTLLKAGTACMDQNVNIPTTIGGVAVTKIGNIAFVQKNLSGVTIPNGVTYIGSSAFSSNYLTSLVIPPSVTSIDKYAFEYNSLTTVSIPTSLTSIGSSAFAYNQLVAFSVPAGTTSITPDSFFGQNPWGSEVKIISHPDYYIYGDNPAANQRIYNNIWYARAYTADPANPQNLSDFAISEQLDIGSDGNQNGTTADSLGGHIINPASTIVRYQDSQGKTLAPDTTVTGLKTGKAPSSALDSSDYLHSYLASESAIPAPLDPSAPTTAELTAMQLGFSQYYRLGNQVTFTPKAIAGYVAPAAQTVTLNQEDNTVTFVYKAAITSVPFADGNVNNGVLTTTPPPAGTLIPLIAQSSLTIASSTGGGGPIPSDCSSFESASLLAPSAINTSTLPDGVTIVGGLNFSLACSSGGQTGIDYALGTTIPYTSKLLVYKYDLATHQLTDITSRIAISSQTIDGRLRTVISYNITDGGELDEDGQVNGVITDPVVIGYEGPLAELTGDTLAETGVSLWLALAAPVAAILLGSGLLLGTRLKNIV